MTSQGTLPEVLQLWTPLVGGHGGRSAEAGALGRPPPGLPASSEERFWWGLPSWGQGTSQGRLCGSLLGFGSQSCCRGASDWLGQEDNSPWGGPHHDTPLTPSSVLLPVASALVPPACEDISLAVLGLGIWTCPHPGEVLSRVMGCRAAGLRGRWPGASLGVWVRATASLTVPSSFLQSSAQAVSGRGYSVSPPAPPQPSLSPWGLRTGPPPHLSEAPQPSSPVLCPLSL